ncbi:ABC-type multidrug transport system ATPase subunit [Okibacterium sp. HSC-33S16]|nr:ABC-type multidrug transport system ATPase subunit [Okibacterium sp. HSC-33S16]
MLLDAKAANKGRSAYKHLLSIAATHGIGAARVREVIGLAGLDSVAGKRVGGFSLGGGTPETGRRVNGHPHARYRRD